jgi:Anti-sigma-28 factor, FlgM
VNVDRSTKVEYIKEEIEQGTYRVDPQAVADAMLRRLYELAGAGPAGLSAEIVSGPFGRN